MGHEVHNGAELADRTRGRGSQEGAESHKDWVILLMEGTGGRGGNPCPSNFLSSNGWKREVEGKEEKVAGTWTK